MLAFDALIVALEGKREGQSYRARCPVHNGRALMLRERDGAILLHCHYGCPNEAVIAELVKLDLWEVHTNEPPEPAEANKLEAQYEYRDAGGVLVAVKGRFRTFSGKTFRWRLANSEEWGGLSGRKESTLPLYGGHALPDGPVYMVEGEKAANACRAVGLTAVCAAGGASAKDFGTSLDVLRGRDVVLWPDNDDPGRGLMRRLHRALEGIADSIRYVAPDVAPKADAYDYFELGGTLSALGEALARIRTEPWVDESPDGYLVSIPDAGGFLRFAVADIEPGRNHALEASVAVWQEIPGQSSERYSGRLNLTSVSGRESFRRQLDEMFGKEVRWTAALNRVCDMVRAAWESRDPTVLLSEAPEVPTAHLLYPYVLAEEPVILFGQGGSFKTYLALSWALSISTGEQFLGASPSADLAVLYIDYESSAWRLRQRMEYLMAGVGLHDTYPPVLYWPANGLPLYEMVSALRRKIREANIGWVVIDSAAMACGHDPEKADAATRYFNALARLQRPTLSLAHVVKPRGDGAETKYPFGSIFWHNGARLTWNIQMTKYGDEAHIGLFNRKGNDDREHEPIGLKVRFEPDAVHIGREDLGIEYETERSAGSRVADALVPGPRSVKELASELSTSEATIRQALHRLETAAKIGTHQDRSSLWSLIRQDVV